MTAAQARFKDFGKTQSVEDYAPLSFKLNDDVFNCRQALPGKLLLDFVRRADSDRGGMAAEAIVDFLKATLVEEDQERFMTALDDPEQIVEVETLGEIAGWLVEQYTTRPTRAQRRSSNSRTSGGRTTTDISLVEE